jgi:hypothetical protein
MIVKAPRHRQLRRDTCSFETPLGQLPLLQLMKQVSFCRSGITKKARAMFKHSKVRQAGLIVFATTLLLILPNLTRLFG